MHKSFCDGEMEPNYWSGTRAAGWQSNDSLVKHGLIRKVDNHRARSAFGFNRGPQNEYFLTDIGAEFIKALLEKYPREHNRHGPAADLILLLILLLSWKADDSVR